MKDKRIQKSKILKSCIMSFLAIGSITSVSMCFEKRSDSKAYISSNTVWEEIPIIEKKQTVLPTFFDFDFNSLIGESDYIFRGTIVNRKEYKVSWTDDIGETWGPYPSSVVEVRINKEYYGESPVQGNTIKVYSSESISDDTKGAIRLNNNNEYIFITKKLDDEFVSQKAVKAPYDKFEQEKHADVYIRNLRDNIMSISGDSILAYNGFIFEKGLSKDDNNDDISLFEDIVDTDEIESNYFILINKYGFDAAFNELISSIKNEQ